MVAINLSSPQSLTWYIPQFLCDRSNMLSNMILRDIVFRSRTVNKNICEQYDGIVTRITTIPDSTEDLVALMKFLDKLELKELQDLKVRYS